MRLDRRCGTPVLLQECDLRRAARQRFEAERTTAREQIEHTRPVDSRLQPVEQGLPHTIGCRTNLHPSRKTQPAAAMAATNDSQRSRSRESLHRRTACTTNRVMTMRAGRRFPTVFDLCQCLRRIFRGLPPFGAQAYATAPIRQVRRIVLTDGEMRPFRVSATDFRGAIT